MNDETIKNVGAAIRKRRLELGFTQEELALLVDTDSGNLSRVETGKQQCTEPMLFLLAEKLETKVYKLYAAIEEPSAVNEDSLHYGSNFSPGPKIRGDVPYISWVTAGELRDSTSGLAEGDALDWFACPVRYGKGTFILKIMGDSMDDNSDKAYKDGDLIYVDPTVRPEHNKDVVVRTPEGKMTFKRIQITPEDTYLLALNPDEPKRRKVMPEGTVVCGVVIFSGKHR